MSNAQTTTQPFSLEALRAGDRNEFTRLVDAYSGVIYRLALKMLNNTQDAEDVLQETFLKAYRGLGKFRWPLKRVHLAVSHCHQRGFNAAAQTQKSGDFD